MKRRKTINRLTSIVVTMAMMMSLGEYVFADEVEETEVPDETIAEETAEEEPVETEETDPIEAEETEIDLETEELIPDEAAEETEDADVEETEAVEESDETEDVDMDDDLDDIEEYEVYDEVIFEDRICFDGGVDNDYLAEQFIMNEMSVGPQVCYRTYDYSSSLSTEGITVFNYLCGKAQEIANGDETNTIVEIPDNVLTLTFTASQLGLANLSDRNAVRSAVAEHLPFTGREMMETLMSACPYEMYWFDKTAGLSFYYYTSNNGRTVTVSGFTFEFPVAQEYQAGEEYIMDASYGVSVGAAAQNARSIIDTYAGLGDYDKLLAYNNQICLLTDYNHAAAGGGMAYGNPWQLVWVFDGDATTTVVCEGYSKAFQYLCDNSVFRSDDVYAISVSGTAYFTYNSGPHMWNVVHMDDGLNYLVDVTNNDPEGDGNYGSELFLIGATSGSISSGYTFSNGYRYVYDDDTCTYFTENALALADSDYELPVDGVAINENNFPDEIFRSYVADNYDVNIDGYLDDDEISSVTSMNLSELGISDLYGIEYFSALVTLNCSYNELSYLSVDGCTSLRTLNCSNNQLLSLSLYECIDLQRLECGWNNLESLDVSCNHELLYLECSNCNITDLELANNTKLVQIYCDHNSIRVLDFAGLAELSNVYCCNMETLEQLVLTGCNSLVYLDCCYCDDLNSINVSACNSISRLYCSNCDDLNTIDVSGCSSLGLIICSGCENLINVDLSGCNSLATLDCSLCENLRCVDVRDCLALIDLNCRFTSIESLNISNNPSLSILECFGANLTSLDISNNPKLILAVEFGEYSDDSGYAKYLYFNTNYSILAVDLGVDIVTSASSLTPGWNTIDGKTYYINDDGTNYYGWLTLSGRKYYLDPETGEMQIGWQEIEGSWYYFKTSGAMITGWKTWGSKTYYFDENGVMLTGWQDIEGNRYYFKTNGTMIRGWKTWGSKTYYFGDDGVMRTGWQDIDGSRYYFKTSGVMVKGWKVLSGKTYYFDPTTGAMYTGLQTIDGKIYYFKTNGIMLTNTSRTINGIVYDFGPDGACTNH